MRFEFKSKPCSYIQKHKTLFFFNEILLENYTDYN